MRREFKDQAIDKCREHINAFGKCAQENGLLVIFNCRQFNKDMNECMKLNNSEEEFKKYLSAHSEDLDRRTIRA